MSTAEKAVCPVCGHETERYRNPVPTVDIIIEYASGIVLIERRDPPHGWALPGGFVDYGETVEHAAHREAKEETALEVRDLRMFHVYSDPGRDSRQHTITTVFVGEGEGELEAGTDAGGAAVFPADGLPKEIAFDHALIIRDYLAWKHGDKNKGMILP